MQSLKALTRAICIGLSIVLMSVTFNTGSSGGGDSDGGGHGGGGPKKQEVRKQ